MTEFQVVFFSCISFLYTHTHTHILLFQMEILKTSILFVDLFLFLRYHSYRQILQEPANNPGLTLQLTAS